MAYMKRNSKLSSCFTCFRKQSSSGKGNNDIANNSNMTNFDTVRQQPRLRTDAGYALRETEEMKKERKKNTDRLKSRVIKYDQVNVVSSHGGQSAVSEITKAKRSELKQPYINPTGPSQLTKDIYNQNLKPSPQDEQQGTNSGQSPCYQTQRHNNSKIVSMKQTSKIYDDSQRINLSNLNELSKDHMSIPVDTAELDKPSSKKYYSNNDFLQNQPHFDSGYDSFQNVSETRGKIESVSTGEAKITRRITTAEKIIMNCQNISHLKPNYDQHIHSPSMNNSILLNTSKYHFNNEQENDFTSKNEQRHDNVNNLSSIHGSRNERMIVVQPNAVATSPVTTSSEFKYGEQKQQQQGDYYPSKNDQQRHDNVNNLSSIHGPRNERMIMALPNAVATSPFTTSSGFNYGQQKPHQQQGDYHASKDDQQRHDNVNNLSNIHGSRNERMIVALPNAVATSPFTTSSGFNYGQQKPQQQQRGYYASKNDQQRHDNVNNLSNIHGPRNERMIVVQPNAVATSPVTTSSEFKYGEQKQQQQGDYYPSKNDQQRHDNVNNLSNIHSPRNERMIVAQQNAVATLPDTTYSGSKQQQQEASDVLAIKYYDYEDDASQSKGIQSMVSIENYGHDPTDDNKIEGNNRESGTKQENALVFYVEEKKGRDAEDILKKIKHIREQANEFSVRIENFTGDSAEHYYIRESLIRLVLKLDELPVEKYEELRKERRSTIKFIYDLCEQLNENK